MANTAALIDTYRRAQQRIIEAILSSKSVAFNAGMLRTINAELARLQGRTVRWVESQIPEAYREGMRSVNKAYEKAYRAAGEVGPKNYPTEFSKINRRAIQLLVDNTKADFDNALGFVGRQIKDDLRQANLQAIADKLASGSTIDKTRKILAEKYASQGLAAIKYKRGGRDAFMSLDAYAGLVARSTTAEATNTACQKQVEEFGDDLVQMTTHANACPLCVSLEGRVYSISGKHPDYPALDLAYSDGYANIHPNCGHRLVPYIADLKTPEEIAEDKRISGRSFDIDKWSPAERAQAESNLKAYKLGQAKKRAIYTDRQQWERYKAELGPDNAPKSLSGFRSMKKANGDNWKELRGQYRTASSAGKQLAEAKEVAEAAVKAVAEAAAKAAAKVAADAAAKAAVSNIPVARWGEYKRILPQAAGDLQRELTTFGIPKDKWYLLREVSESRWGSAYHYVSDSGPVNRTLRGLPLRAADKISLKSGNYAIDDVIHNLDALIQSYEVTEPVVVNRTVSAKFALNNFRVGTQFKDPGFVSTSMGSKMEAITSYSFGAIREGGQTVLPEMVELLLPAGKNVGIPLDQITPGGGHAAEFLIRRDAIFEIVGRKDDGTWLMNLIG